MKAKPIFISLFLFLQSSLLFISIEQAKPFFVYAVAMILVVEYQLFLISIIQGPRKKILLAVTPRTKRRPV